MKHKNKIIGFVLSGVICFAAIRPNIGFPLAFVVFIGGFIIQEYQSKKKSKIKMESDYVITPAIQQIDTSNVISHQKETSKIKKPAGHYFISVFLLFMAIIFIISGTSIYLVMNTKINRCTEITLATVDEVVSHKYRSSNGNSYQAYPILVFEVDGIWYREQYDISMYPSPFHEGQELEIQYNPDNISEFFIINDKAVLFFNVLFPMIFIVVGFIMGIISTITFVNIRKR